MNNSCNHTCALCPNEKFYYINFSKVHGLCRAHTIPTSTIIKCTKCAAIVPVLTYKEINKFCYFCKAPITSSAHTCSEPICENCFNYSDLCPYCNKDFIIFTPDQPANAITNLKFRCSQTVVENNRIKFNFSKIESADAAKNKFQLINIEAEVNKTVLPLEKIEDTQNEVRFTIEKVDDVKKDNAEYTVQVGFVQRLIKTIVEIFSCCSLCRTKQETL